MYEGTDRARHPTVARSVHISYRCDAYVIHQALVDVGRLSLGVQNANHGWYRIDEEPELPLPRSQRFFDNLLIVYVDQRSVPCDDLTLPVASGTGGGAEPTVCAIAAAKPKRAVKLFASLQASRPQARNSLEIS